MHELHENIIDIKDLSFSYPDGTHVLKEISMSVKARERIALIGPNGSGKSTFLALLPGLLRGKGTIKITGMDMIDKNLGAIRRRVGLVFQDPDDQLFCPTVYDDVAFGPINLRLNKAQVDEKVDMALGLVSLKGFKSRSPFHLSVGEKKRVGLATVLSTTPEILLLDEPTSNLDPRQRRKLIEWILNFDRTFIIATHDLDLATRVSNRCIMLNDGKIVAEGPTTQILGDQALLENHGL